MKRGVFSGEATRPAFLLTTELHFSRAASSISSGLPVCARPAFAVIQAMPLPQSRFGKCALDLLICAAYSAQLEIPQFFLAHDNKGSIINVRIHSAEGPRGARCF